RNLVPVGSTIRGRTSLDRLRGARPNSSDSLFAFRGAGFEHVVTDIFHEHRNEGRRFCNNAPNVAKKRMISMAIRPEVFPDQFSDCHSQMELLHINPQPSLRVIDEDKYGTILRGGEVRLVPLVRRFLRPFAPRPPEKARRKKVTWSGHRGKKRQVG
ncbi:hypothetical protein K0M31_011523, partial [Melipona bicolor]